MSAELRPGEIGQLFRLLAGGPGPAEVIRGALRGGRPAVVAGEAGIGTSRDLRH